jgi:hypothetical protein
MLTGLRTADCFVPPPTEQHSTAELLAGAGDFASVALLCPDGQNKSSFGKAENFFIFLQKNLEN